MKIPQISESELEVMKVLWKESPQSSGQIVDSLSTCTEWKPKTIQTLITRLMTKGAISAQKNGKAYLYSPVVSEEAYKAEANQNFLSRLYNGSINLMLASFVKEKSLTKSEIEELKQILEGESQ